MATERKTYTYTPFTYKEYKPSIETNTAKENLRKADSAVNNNGHYTMSQDVIDALGLQTNAENAYNAHYNTGFTFSQDEMLKTVMDQINNREKFSYDLNGDALYQQYKDKYIQQGKMAMQDTMGQAAAMTGGYGSSYSASVGNQAYQASLQQLNDIIPELYQMAYDRYNQEGQDLYNQYGLLSNERSTEYGMWTDTGNRLASDRGYYSDNANNVFNRDYGIWTDKTDRLYADREYYAGRYDTTADRDYGMYSDDRDLAYDEHTASEGYKYQDVADANAWELANTPTTTTTTTTSQAPSLTAQEYNDVLMNAEAYADQGETALANYLNGLVARGLSKDEAAAIYKQYFPSLVPDPPKKGNTGANSGGGGARNTTYHTLN